MMARGRVELRLRMVEWRLESKEQNTSRLEESILYSNSQEERNRACGDSVFPESNIHLRGLWNGSLS